MRIHQKAVLMNLVPFVMSLFPLVFTEHERLPGGGFGPPLDNHAAAELRASRRRLSATVRQHD